jgi:putative copper export protein
VTTAGPAALAPALDGIRVSIHVLAAAVWVGGQITLAGLVPTARGLGEGAARALGLAFARIQWPAYGVLLVTGFWNVSATHSGQPAAWKVVLVVKIVFVVVAGLAAWLHTRAATKAAVAAWGAITAVTSVTALALGVFLAG